MATKKKLTTLIYITKITTRKEYQQEEKIMGNNTSSDEDVQDYDDLDEDLTLLIPTLELVVAQLD